MFERSGRALEIMDVAERAARAGGYGAFSFREIAKEVGVKPASVHYHFPTKADLGRDMARRYTERFLDALPDADDADLTPAEAMASYLAAFRRSLSEDGLMCLCGALGAEIALLPEPVAREAKLFFRRNIDWLKTLYRRTGANEDKALRKARRTLALLEGAMILARTDGGLDAFDDATGALTKNL